MAFDFENSGPNRITVSPHVMGGKPCIRGMRITVGTIVGLLASGHDEARVLELYPYLEPEDIRRVREYSVQLRLSDQSG